ncbi:MAG: D-erythronate dehydrogenase [Burkholderiaceae bacterium]
MRVLITGGAGFLGQRLALALLERGHIPDASGQDRGIDEVCIVDTVLPQDLIPHSRINYWTLDIADPKALDDLFAVPPDAIFHLAAVVSAQAEADFALGMRVNLDGTRNLFECCRRVRERGHLVRLVFASSVAVFGGTLPEIVTDDTAPTPEGSYGAQKLIAEILVRDYARKRFIDARAVRVPTIVVRPGKPNGAASGFASGIIREPMGGLSAVCPVPPDTAMWIASPRSAVAALIHAYTLAAEQWGVERSLNLPGLTVQIAEMVEALKDVAGAEAVKRIVFRTDAAIEALVRSWPARFDPARALRLGFTADADIRSILTQYRDDFLRRSAAH